jgi:hypothetical protein
VLSAVRLTVANGEFGGIRRRITHGGAMTDVRNREKDR